MVVNAIGAGWIIVIGRPLCAYRVQFFLCNHAHVVPIAVLLLLLLLAGAVHVVAGFSANGRRWNKLMHCIALLLLLLPLTCIDKRRCPGSSPRAVPCRRTAGMSCTHCDCSDAARSASAWAAAMMSRLDPLDRYPMRCGRYSMSSSRRRRRGTRMNLALLKNEEEEVLKVLQHFAFINPLGHSVATYLKVLLDYFR